MATNIEIKARVANMGRLQSLAEQISDTPCVILDQEDVFFNTPQGRLKLRILAPDSGQLIYYTRQDTAGPKRSDYTLYYTGEPDILRGILRAAYGIRGVVRKQRRLYTVGNTRIHLDQVEGLGAFMELEVVLRPDQSEQQGQRVADGLMAQLEIQETDLVAAAYIDLLSDKEK